ncbi:MAG: AAA family ATPase [Gemmatimonadales bacterium]
MAASFQLKCLGIPELRGPDGKVIRFRVKKHLALLVYLAVERRGAHDRARLVEMFWPKAGTAKGRHSLATALSLLRSIFGRAAFGPGRATIRFSPVRLTLDLDRLSAGDVLGADGEAPLEVDGFLRGFDLVDAPEFGIWKDREHARRLPAIHSGLLTLIDHGRRRGSHDEVMERADRLLAIDHLAEEGIRAKIEALTLAGDRFSALRVFDEWKAQLKDEVGAEPSALLEGMAAQLRKRGWEPRAPVAITPVPAEQWRDRRFVGRGVEFRRLYEIWETTHQFRPRQVVILGDPGIGKTTLAQRLVTAAGLEGASVTRVQCFHLEQQLPYSAVGGLVEGLLGKPGVATTSPESLAALCLVAPGVKDHFLSLPHLAAPHGETTRLLIAEALADLLQSVAEERPTLLVLDDIHQSDEASLGALHAVVRRLRDERFMILATARSPDGTANPGWRASESFSRGDCDRIQLEPMQGPETRELLESILEGEAVQIRPPERRALIHASGGFPMALELLTQDWLNNGKDSLALALGAMTATLTEGLHGRADIYAAVADRVISGLSHSATQVATLASVLGRRAGDLSLYALVDLSFGQTVEGVSELTSRRLLRSVGTNLEFSNELVRAHVYGRVPAPIRTALHSLVSDRLLAIDAGGGSVPGLEIAWHLVRSGRRVEATGFLMRGSVEARSQGAPDEAILALESALPDLEADAAVHGRLLLADLYQELGQWREAIEALPRGAGLREEERTGRMVLETHSRWQLGELDTALAGQAITDLIAASRGETRPAAGAFLLAARLATHSENDEVMRDVLAQCPAESPADPLERQIGRAMLHYNLREIGHATRCAKLAEAQITLHGRADTLAVRLVAGLAVLQIVSGDYEIALDTMSRATRMAERLENRTLLGELYSLQSLCQLSTRRYDLAAATSAAAIDRLSAYRAPSYFVHALANGALAQALLGKPAPATSLLEIGDQLVQGDLPGAMREDWLLSKADVLWALGRRKSALNAAEDAIAAVGGNPVPLSFCGKLSRWMARSATIKGEAGIAYQRLDAVTEALDRLDAIDQVDLLAARIALARAMGIQTAASLEADLGIRAGRLSVSTRSYLANLDVALPV